MSLAPSGPEGVAEKKPKAHALLLSMSILSYCLLSMKISCDIVIFSSWTNCYIQKKGNCH